MATGPILHFMVRLCFVNNWLSAITYQQFHVCSEVVAVSAAVEFLTRKHYRTHLLTIPCWLTVQQL